jgi:maleate isomerase
MRRAIGTILPSSNRSVERVTIAVLRHFPELDACFARIPFHGQGIGQPPDAYDAAPYREAAAQLRHAAVEVVCWNGSRGAALGLTQDEALCAAMAAEAGCAATTAALATARLLGVLGARRLGFVVPGEADDAVRAAAGLGGELVAAHGLGQSDNFAAACTEPGDIASAVRQVAKAGPDAVLIWSTNLPGWPVVPALEDELGLPVIDSGSAGVWGALAALGLDPAPARALGRIFGCRPGESPR